MGSDIPLWQFLASQLEHRQNAGLMRSPRTFRSLSGRLLVGTDGRQLINFGSNDYLGLSWHPQLRARHSCRSQSTDWLDNLSLENLSTELSPPPSPSGQSHASPPHQACHLDGGPQSIDGHETAENSDQEDRYGAGASPLLAGHSTAHQDLREATAKFEGMEDAVLFSSGYAANVGVVSALAGRGDVIFSDSLNHASLIDGSRLSKATVHIFRHNDIEHLKSLIEQHRQAGRHAFILTDSLFSMDGDIADLRAIECLSEKYDLIPIVDEAHATGVYGQGGSGLLDALHCTSDRWIKVGTYSKAIGCSGGFVACNGLVAKWLHNFARSYVYSTSIPVAHCETIRCAMQLLRSMDKERESLRDRSLQLRERLRKQGLRVGGTDSPIIAVYAPDVATVVAWSRALTERGFYVPAIRPPTVPADSPMLRISISNSHLPADLDRLAESCRF